MKRDARIEDDEAEYHDAMCAARELLAQRYDFDRSRYAT